MTWRCQHGVDVDRPGNVCERCTPPEPTVSEPDYFGRFFTLLQEHARRGGSELGVGLTLFALAASVRARNVCEIGRHKGFSGLALGSALKLLDEGWRDHDSMHSRVGVDYAAHEADCERRCYSIDPDPQVEAERLWKEAGIDRYMLLVDCRSQDAKIDDWPDLDAVFIDGDHNRERVMADVDKYGNKLRPGGLMVMHDYFGPYDKDQNISGVKAVVGVVTQERYRNWILLDTGYPSCAILRKPGGPQ